MGLFSMRLRGIPMKKVSLRYAQLVLLVLASLVAASVLVRASDDTSSSLPAPPVAKKVPRATEINGHTMVDNYYWLRDKKNPEVTAYLEAENAYTQAVMKPTEPLQATLYQEMLGRIKQTDLTVPYRKGDYVYYSRTEEGKQYPIHCRRRHEADDAKEEIILDLNGLAQGHKF